MGCSTRTSLVTDSMTVGLAAKVVESGTKTTKKRVEMMGRLHIPDRT